MVGLSTKRLSLVRPYLPLATIADKYAATHAGSGGKA